MLKRIGRKFIRLQLDYYLRHSLRQKLKKEINISNPKRFLCLQLNSIGDTIMTQPAWSSLKSSLPDAEIDLVCSSHIAPLFEADPDIRSIYGVDTKHFRSWCIKKKRQFKNIWSDNGYDFIIDFTALPISCVLCSKDLSPASIGFQRKIQSNRSKINLGGGYEMAFEYSEQAPVRKMMLQLVSPWVPQKEQSQIPMLFFSPESERQTIKCLQRLSLKTGEYIVIQPGAKWPPRKWPFCNFATLIDQLSVEFESSIVLLGGPGDEAFIGKIANHIRPSSAISYITADILEFAGLIKNALICVCNDSAAMHISAAAGTNSVAFFGPGTPFRTAPSKKEGCTIFYEDLFCNPCTQYYAADRCRRGINFCMHKINPLAVFDKIKNILEFKIANY